MEAVARVAKESEMRSRVGKCDGRVGIAQHAADRTFVGIEKRGGEDALEIFGQSEVEEPIERRLACGGCERRNISAFANAMLRANRAQQLELLPFPVEETDRRGTGELRSDAAAELRVGIDAFQILAPSPHRRLPGLKALEGIG